MNDLKEIDMTLPWATVDEQFRQAYWRACGPVQPRRDLEATIPTAALAVHRLWTAAFYVHPGSPGHPAA